MVLAFQFIINGLDKANIEIILNECIWQKVKNKKAPISQCFL